VALQVNAHEFGNVAETGKVKAHAFRQVGGVRAVGIETVALFVERNAAVPVGEVDRNVIGGHPRTFPQVISKG
jgi:hypothetical protein